MSTPKYFSKYRSEQERVRAYKREVDAKAAQPYADRGARAAVGGIVGGAAGALIGAAHYSRGKAANGLPLVGGVLGAGLGAGIGYLSGVNHDHDVRMARGIQRRGDYKKRLRKAFVNYHEKQDDQDRRDIRAAGSRARRGDFNDIFRPHRRSTTYTIKVGSLETEPFVPEFFNKLAQAKKDKKDQRGVSGTSIAGAGLGAVGAGVAGTSAYKGLGQKSKLNKELDDLNAEATYELALNDFLQKSTADELEDVKQVRFNSSPAQKRYAENYDEEFFNEQAYYARNNRDAYVDHLEGKKKELEDSYSKALGKITNQMGENKTKMRRGLGIGGALAAGGLGLHLLNRNKRKQQDKTSALFNKLAESESGEANPYLVPGVIAGSGAGVSAGLGRKAIEGLKERSATKKPIKDYSRRVSDLEGAKRAITSGDLVPLADVGLDDAMVKHKGELDKLKGAKSKATKKMLGFGAGSALAAAGAAYGGKKLYDAYKARNQDKTAAKRPTFSSDYDDSPELKGGQKRLPDALQKKIVVSKLKSRIAKKRARHGS